MGIPKPWPCAQGPRAGGATRHSSHLCRYGVFGLENFVVVVVLVSLVVVAKSKVVWCVKLS